MPRRDRIDPIAWLNDDASFMHPHSSVSYFGGSGGRSGRTILGNEHDLAAIRAVARFLTDSLPTAAGMAFAGLLGLGFVRRRRAL